MRYVISEEYLQRTPILNKDHLLIISLVDELMTEHTGKDREFLQAAHQWLAQHLRPVYTLNERQPASTTLARGCGSCSQRMAVLEAVARAAGIATRSRALWIDGQFWRSRFPQLQRFLPQKVLLAWPEFFIDGSWVGFEELYGPLHALAEQRSDGFTNATGETLFEAVRYTAVDWSGKTCSCAIGSVCDLSHVVAADGGIFSSRDAVFDRYGLLLHQPGGCLFELLFGGHKAA
jgi:transglutaminase superfamily protein